MAGTGEFEVDPAWKALPEDEQRRLFEEYMEQWMAVGMCSDPADVAMATEGIRGSYRSVNLPEPKIIGYVQSPLAATVAGPALEMMLLRLFFRGEDVEDRPVTPEDPSPSLAIIAPVFAAARESIRNFLRAGELAAKTQRFLYNLRKVVDTPWRPTEPPAADADDVSNVPAEAQQRLELDSALACRAYLAACLLDPEKLQLAGFPVSGSVPDIADVTVPADWVATGEDEQLQAVLQNAMHVACHEMVPPAADLITHIKKVLFHRRGGNLWAGWHGEIGYYRDVCKLKHPELEHFAYDEMIAKSCGWVWFGRYVSVFSDRALYIRTRGSELHCDDGPVAEWPDGTKFWMLEGQVVNEQIVMRPETQTLEDVLGETNTEIRRIRIERLGWERLLEIGNAELLDERFNERDQQPEKLFKMRLGDLELHRIQFVDPSTGRKYVQGVPTDVTTCEEAQRVLSHGLSDILVHRS